MPNGLPRKRSARRRLQAAADRIAAYAHLAAIVPALVTPGMGVLGATVVWLFGRHLSPVIDTQAREAMDFQLSMVLAAALFFEGLTALAGVPVASVTPLLLAFFLLSVVTPLFAATATSRGERWRYPLSLRLMRRACPAAA